MIKGHIDLVTPTRVEGWAYAAGFAVRGMRLLAWIDDVCLGGGVVGVYRQDLAEAGLGDGHLGFSFDIHLERPMPLGRLFVSFEGSDFILRGPRARLRDAEEAEGAAGIVPDEIPLWQFACRQGWIAEDERQQLNMLARYGCCEVPLPVRERKAATQIQAQAMAERMLSVHALEPTRLETGQLDNLEGLARLRDLSVPRLFSRQGVVALWSPRARPLRIVEGSHRLVPLEQRAKAAEGMIEYQFGGQILLLLNIDCVVAPVKTSLKDDLAVSVWFAHPVTGS